MKINDELFTVPGAARYCSVSRGTLWRCVKSGHLKAFLTPGGHYRILKKDLEVFMNKKGMCFPCDDDQKKEKILIVDDDSMVKNLFSEILSSDGYQVDIASDGFEAGAKTIQCKPDLIILDLFMPGIDGFDVCKQIKNNSGLSHIKILACTGYGTQEKRDRIMKSGADGFLIKPVDRTTLLNNVSVLLRQK